MEVYIHIFRRRIGVVKIIGAGVAVKSRLYINYNVVSDFSIRFHRIIQSINTDLHTTVYRPEYGRGGVFKLFIGVIVVEKYNLSIRIYRMQFGYDQVKIFREGGHTLSKYRVVKNKCRAAFIHKLKGNKH